MTFKDEKATVSHLPGFCGDGYGYGGSAVLTIAGRSILLGESEGDNELAWEIANRWNAAIGAGHD
jgi:hypothetical protein